MAVLLGGCILVVDDQKAFPFLVVRSLLGRIFDAPILLLLLD